MRPWIFFVIPCGPRSVFNKPSLRHSLFLIGDRQEPRHKSINFLVRGECWMTSGVDSGEKTFHPTSGNECKFSSDSKAREKKAASLTINTSVFHQHSAWKKSWTYCKNAKRECGHVTGRDGVSKVLDTLYRHNFRRDAIAHRAYCRHSGHAFIIKRWIIMRNFHFYVQYTIEPPCATTSRKRPSPISDHQSKTSKLSQSKPCSCNL